MASKIMLAVALLAFISQLALATNTNSNENNNNNQQISIRMPNIKPDYAEQYLCYSHRLRADDAGQFIVGFEPKADARRVHHMLVYGCETPGLLQRDSPDAVWDCSEMQLFGEQPFKQTYRRAPVCRGRDDHVLYGWAMDAPALRLPEGVGFKVGGAETQIKYLVLQIHYGHHHHFFSLMPSLTDNSGILLDVKPNAPESGITKQASVLLLISLGQVLPGRSKHQIWCKIDEDIEIHPFKFRVHTHQMGTKVLGAKLGEKSAIIGVGNPQEPQMFHPVEDKFMTIRQGDEVMAQCEFYNNKTHAVDIGQNGDDEMCNFYIMYWTDSPKLLSKRICYGQNPPQLFDDN